MAGITLLILAAYASSLQTGDVPPKRRRIRTANTLLMMLTTPLIAYAFGILTPSNVRLFLLTWLAIAGLLGMMIMLAAMDALHSAQLHRQQRREVRRALRAAIARHPAGAAPGSESPLHDDHA
jgi:hypothetical protein